MNLHEQLESYGSAHGDGDALRSAAVHNALGRRIRRGRAMRAGAMAGGTLAAVGLVASGAVNLPEWWPSSASPATSVPSDTTSDGSVPTSASAAPTAPTQASVGPVDPASMPAVTDDGYLVRRGRFWTTDALLACDAAAVAEPGADDAWTDDAPLWPVPAWLETGRLYGWGDDALIGGYPIPVVHTAQDGNEHIRATMTELAVGPVNLTLMDGKGEVWGYSVLWSDRDDLPHDEPGLFVELNADWECNSDLPAEGVYEARLAYERADGTAMVAEIGAVTVVSGVPSLPEVDAAGR